MVIWALILSSCTLFTWAAWNYLRTIALVFWIAEVKLVPVMPYKIAHINLSSKSKENAERELKEYESETNRMRADSVTEGTRKAVETPIVGWHTGSYPFVCILMMSDVRNMVGGETAIPEAQRRDHQDVRSDSGKLPLHSPFMDNRLYHIGFCNHHKGRYIAHQVMRALGAQDRITAVTSERPPKVCPRQR